MRLSVRCRRILSQFRRLRSYRVRWSTWICYADSGRRKVPEYKERTAGYVSWNARRTSQKRLYLIRVTTGASNDIEKATSVARAMITLYGMVRRFGLIGLESVQNRYLDGRPVMNCGQETATEIDHEVMKMLKRSMEELKKLLSEHRESLDKIQHSD